MHASYLSLQNISKSFIVHDSKRHVLTNLSYTFNQQESYAITGVSGSGKSTLLHIIAGFLQPNSGLVLYNDTPIDQLGMQYLQQSIGVMFQQPYLLADLSLVENIALKDILYGSYSEQSKNYIQELCAVAGLQDHIHTPVAALSGGQQQRVALLRALYMRPRFLLVDEPTANVDSAQKKAILELLQYYHTQYTCGLIIITHDTIVTQYTSKQLVLKDGGLYSLQQNV